MKLLFVLSIIIALVFFALFAGYHRVYYGSGMKTQLVPKDSFSFKDTIVNLDDLLGQPRIVVATKHPAVKRQLEQMGIIETDQQVQERVRREMDAEAQRIRKEIEAEAQKMRRELGF